MTRRAFAIVAAQLLVLCLWSVPVFGQVGDSKPGAAIEFALHGPWDVYLGQLVDYDDLGTKAPDGSMDLPGYLSHLGPDSGMTGLSHGVATLHHSVTLPTELETMSSELAVFVDRIFSVGRVLIVTTGPDGNIRRVSFEAGTIRADGKGMRAIYRPGIIPVGNPTRLDIFIQMANEEIPWLGMERVPVVGPLKHLTNLRERKMVQGFLVAGALLLIGLYYLFLFSLRPSAKASLYFACFSLLAVVRTAVMSRMWTTAFPESDLFGFFLRLELWTASGIGFFFILYFLEVIPDFVNKNLSRFFLAALLFHGVIVWVLPLYLAYGTGLQVQQVLALGVIAMLIGALLLALRKQPTIAVKVLAVGVCILSFSVVNDVFHSLGYINTLHVIPFGVAALALCQGLVIAVFNARDRRMAEVLSGELNQRNQELRRIGDLKDQFLANTSHELRTPLNGIIGLSETILDGIAGHVGPGVEKNVRMIARNGRRLAMLVNDILDFSKLRKGDVSINIENVDLADHVDLVDGLCAAWAAEKGLDLIVQVESDSYFVRADRNRLDQILLNIVQCSLRYTKRGKIVIRAQYSGERINVVVEDTGEGLPDEVLRSLREEYEEVPINTGSDGLGLSVTKSLVELQSGTLEVESKPGGGTIFSLSFPRGEREKNQGGRLLSRVSARPTGDISRASALENASGSLRLLELPERSGRKVLVVDDEPINGHVLRQMLEFEGHEVQVVESGEAGLEVMAEVEFDLVLLDLMLPGMSGYDVLNHIRSFYEKPKVPVLIITARGFAEDLSKSFELGADDYIAKPFTRAEVMARANHHLKMTQYNDEMMGVYGRLADEVTERQQLSASWDDVETVRDLLRQKSDKLQKEENALNAEMSKLEDLILQADKMAALGQMVAGISHDIANPLGYVVLSASELMRELMVLKSASADASRSETAFPGVADLVESIDSEARRVGRISRAMRDYTRLDSSPVVGVEVESLVSDCLLILGHRLDGAKVELVCQQGLSITCYRSHLGQVITNLISNSLRSMDHAGEQRLEIGTRLIPRDAQEGIEIWVGDSGPGVPASQHEHIFDLFHALRDDNVETSVGLGLCAMVVEEHGGTIEIGISQYLGGSEIRIWVPCLPQIDSINLGLS